MGERTRFYQNRFGTPCHIVDEPATLADLGFAILLMLTVLLYFEEYEYENEY